MQPIFVTVESEVLMPAGGVGRGDSGRLTANRL